MVTHGGGRVQLPRRSLVHKHRLFLRRLQKKTRVKLERLIRYASAGEIKTLVEIIRNLLRGKFPGLTASQRKKLRPYKNIFRQVAKPNVSLEDRKLLLNQHGGFLGTVLVPLLGMLLSTIVSALV
jgi:hypothetical protein